MEAEATETVKLGQEFSQEELKLKFKAIYGGVAWPGKKNLKVQEGKRRQARPGCAVVVGMGRDKHFDNYDIYLLDEFESMDMRDVVKKCGAFDHKYQPAMWFGDSLNDAADRFIKEMNSEFNREDSEQSRRPFSVCLTPILDMNCLYPYILPEIKRLLDKERRQLFMGDSKILYHLVGIEPHEMSAMELGDFPAIEALAFAVIEMRRYGAQVDFGLPTETDSAQSYEMQTAF